MAIFYVWADSPSPATPYDTSATAAHTFQDLISYSPVWNETSIVIDVIAGNDIDDSGSPCMFPVSANTTNITIKSDYLNVVKPVVKIYPGRANNDGFYFDLLTETSADSGTSINIQSIIFKCADGANYSRLYIEHIGYKYNNVINGCEFDNVQVYFDNIWKSSTSATPQLYITNNKFLNLLEEDNIEECKIVSTGISYDADLFINNNLFVSGIYGLTTYGAFNKYRIYNNICVSQTAHGMYLDCFITDGVCDYNNFYNYGVSGVIAVVLNNPVIGIHNTSGNDPLFANSAIGDFTLLSGSPCVDVGIGHYTEGATIGDYSVPYLDALGCERPYNVITDIGPLELSASPPMLPQGIASFSYTVDPVTNRVWFLDTSEEQVNSWHWDFGNSTAISTVQNPTIEYAVSGNYVVSLSAFNALGQAVPFPFTELINVHASSGGSSYISITYDGNDNTGGITPIDSNVYNWGDTVTVKNNTFERIGYTWKNWNTLPNGTGTSYDSSATFVILGQVVLYAQWQATIFDTNRYGENRKLNLVKFLPTMETETEIEQFTQFLEDFLNTLFDGNNGMSLSASEVSVSGNYQLSGVSGILVPYSYENPISAGMLISADNNSVERIQILPNSNQSNKISILEKVYRLTELKDPDLIDIDYIQYFAANMGYNIDVYRSEIGNIGDSIGNYANRSLYSTSATSAVDANKYLRYMISNLPNWYKIKSTNNAIKVMLYSFGLVADIIQYYTSNYLNTNDGGQWVQGIETDLPHIPKNYFCTPHFVIRIFIDSSLDLLTDMTQRSSVIRAIQSIQPINTVFRNLSGYAARSINLNMIAMTRFTRYMRIL